MAVDVVCFCIYPDAPARFASLSRLSSAPLFTTVEMAFAASILSAQIRANERAQVY